MSRVLRCARRSARLHRTGAYGSCAVYGIRNERQKIRPGKRFHHNTAFQGPFSAIVRELRPKKTPFCRNMPEVSAAGANQGLCEGFMAQMPQVCRAARPYFGSRKGLGGGHDAPGADKPPKSRLFPSPSSLCRSSPALRPDASLDGNTGGGEAQCLLPCVRHSSRLR